MSIKRANGGKAIKTFHMNLGLIKIIICPHRSSPKIPAHSYKSKQRSRILWEMEMKKMKKMKKKKIKAILAAHKDLILGLF
jgi:hypothetical protein